MKTPRSCRSSIRGLGLGLALTLAGCAPGLPPEPPGRDAADPAAVIPRYTPGPSSLDRSVFSDAALRGEGDDAGTNDHVHHGHHGHGAATQNRDGADRGADTATSGGAAPGERHDPPTREGQHHAH